MPVRRCALSAGALLLLAGGVTTVRADFAASINLSGLFSGGGLNGIAFNGIAGYDNAGRSVASAGDINGDGIDDLIIGAEDAAGLYSPPESGESYIVFGDLNFDGMFGNLPLVALNGTNGFVIRGIESDDQAGEAVAGAGDVNGDGFADVIIGAQNADPNGEDSGQSYVVFGGATVGNTGAIQLASVNGQNGFALNGIQGSDLCGSAVSHAGDLNDDGIVDITDLNLVLGNFSQTGDPGPPAIPGDLKADGVVNISDLNLVLGNFQMMCVCGGD